MPTPEPEEDLTPEQLAALDAWEAEQEDAPTPPLSRGEELTRLFSQKPEVQELKRITQAANEGIEGDEVAVPITIPKAFVAMVEHLERKEAAAAGRPPRTAAEVIRLQVMNDLHDTLHMLTVSPGSHEYYRKLWNDFCDAQGAPGEKIEPK